MIDLGHPLPLTRQAQALGINRGSVYYQPRPVSAADEALMRLIDRLYLKYPFAGVRMLRDLLHPVRFTAGHMHVSAADAQDEPRGAVPQAQHQPAATAPPGLPIPASRSGDHEAEPSLGDGHHLHPDGPRPRLLPRYDHGLSHADSPSLAGLDSDGHRVLSGSPEEALSKHGPPRS